MKIRLRFILNFLPQAFIYQLKKDQGVIEMAFAVSHETLLGQNNRIGLKIPMPLR
jgi:hypothetical protein